MSRLPLNKILSKTTRARVWDRAAAMRSLNEGLQEPVTEVEQRIVDKLAVAQGLVFAAIDELNRALGVG